MEASSRARADHDDPTVQLFSPRKEWFTRVFRRRPGPTHEASPLDTNPLLAFASEIEPPAPASAVGRISVVTDPPGARVSIDGQALGVSPLTVSVLTADEHRVSVRSDAGSAERVVAVERGATASVVFSLPKTSAPVGGWLAVNAPFEVQVLERDEVVGASGTTKIMLAAGKHDVLLVNRALGYQETRKFEVTGGKVTTVRVDPPKATLSVNARPWAEVTIDANSVGQTPIANLAVTIGTHQVTFRHPQFGERRQTVLVTTKGPNR